MWRIHFTPDDLARVRLAPGPDPACEIVRSLDVLDSGSGEPVFGQWRRRVRTCLGGASRRFAQQLASGGDRRLAQRYFDRFLAPHWAHIRQCVDEELRRLTDLMVRGGAECVLSEASPLLRWEAPVLSVAGKPDNLDIFPKGRGVVLQPAFFAYDDCTVRASPDGTQVLVFPVRQQAGWCDAAGPASRRQVLRTLLGRTRAQVLERLAEGHCTTSELAADLELSVASASQHAKVLREAGLVSSGQAGKAVVHKASWLGLELLERVPHIHVLSS